MAAVSDCRMPCLLGPHAAGHRCNQGLIKPQTHLKTLLCRLMYAAAPGTEATSRLCNRVCEVPGPQWVLEAGDSGSAAGAGLGAVEASTP